MKVIDVLHKPAVLKQTYVHGKSMPLPRIIMLNDKGNVIYGDIGLPGDLRSRMHKAYTANRAAESAISLSTILSEVQTANGQSITLEDLPKADIYIVDYWAAWCAPCRVMARDLDSIMGSWKDKRFVWIKVESDPEKLPKS